MTVIGDETTEIPHSMPPAPAGPPRVRRHLDLGNWGGRLLLVAIAALIFVGPEIISTPSQLSNWAEYLCYAVIAVGLDLAWGYGGMLALGHGVFFGLGAYAMGMYLTLEQVPDGSIPKFMSLYSDYEELPALWRPFKYLWFAAPAAVLVPILAAALIGWPVFRRKVRGPFFALLTQATALIFVLLLVGQLQLTAGTNGLTNFTTVFGRNPYDPDTTKFLFYLAGAALMVVLIVSRALVRSRYGRLLVATRDAEDRVRFLGYDPAVTKTVAFAVSAGMAGLAGALAAPIIGIVAPNQFAAVPSILMICWVAVGGRGTLYGALLGAIVVNWGQDIVSDSHPQDWELYRGLLFVGVIAFAPGGLLGLARRIGRLPVDAARGRRKPANAVGALEGTA